MKKELVQGQFDQRYIEIGYKISYCRKHLQLTQEQLAEIMGISMEPREKACARMLTAEELQEPSATALPFPAARMKAVFPHIRY